MNEQNLRQVKDLKKSTPVPGTYTGTVSGEKREGNGEMVFKDNDRGLERYVGTWSKDFMNHGKMTLKDGVYEGAFLNNYFEGAGKWTTSSGIYEGTFARGELVKGTYKGSGEYKKGAFIHDTLVGDGTWIDSTGNKIVGKFSEGKPLGGVFKIDYANGDKYEGKLVESGDRFVPNDDRGKLTTDTKVILGNFVNGHASGSGVITYPTGTYTGFIDRGNPHGYGAMTYKNGKTYKGSWTRGKKNGEGILTYHKKTWKGTWDNGKLKSITGGSHSKRRKIRQYRHR